MARPVSWAATTPSGDKHAMVEGIVEEQDLGRLDNDGSQRQEAGFDHPVHGGAGGIAEGNHDRADGDIGDQDQDDSRECQPRRC